MKRTRPVRRFFWFYVVRMPGRVIRFLGLLLALSFMWIEPRPMLCKCRGCMWQEILMFVAGLMVFCAEVAVVLLVLLGAVSAIFWAFGYGWVWPS